MREFTIGALVRPRVLAATCVALALVAMPASSFADYWDAVRNSGRCVSNCNVPVQVTSYANSHSDPGPQLPSLYQINAPFQDVLRLFGPYTGLAKAYADLPAPTSVQELDLRISNFYVGAYRVNDNLQQALDLARAKVADYTRWAAEKQRYIDANRNLPAILRQQLNALNATLSKWNVERSRWQDRIARVRAAETHFGNAASDARADVFVLFDYVSPPGTLVANGELLLAAEQLRLSFPRKPSAPQGPMFMRSRPSAGSLEPPAPRWRPVERPLSINTGASRDQKLASLRDLVPVIVRTETAIDAAIVDLRARKERHAALTYARERLQIEVKDLSETVALLPGQIAAVQRETREAKGEYLAERDRLSLRAVQTWIWTTCRDDMVIPEVKEFLISNGLTRAAARLDAGHINEFIQEVRSITWSSVAPIHGIDAFMAVQQKVLDLLDPLKSRILQSAQFNGLMTTADAAQYAREVHAQLGQDGTEVLEAGGQFQVDAAYRDLVTRLFGPMPPRRDADDL